jgi:hypothetical protein
MQKAEDAAVRAAHVQTRALGTAGLFGGAALLVAAVLYSQKRRVASKLATQQASADLL